MIYLIQICKCFHNWRFGRGYSKTPILTMYALSNFTLVFLSCAFTVLILRLHYRQPLVPRAKFNQLPNFLKIFLFKYVAPLIFIKIAKPKEPNLNSFKRDQLSNDLNESQKLLHHLRKLNQTIKGVQNTQTKLAADEQNMIFEEWKMAALILDRYWSK